MRSVLTCCAMAALLASTPANAVKLQTKILSPDGEPLYDDLSPGAITAGKKCADEGEKRCLTLELVIRNALLAAPIETSDPKGAEQEKFDRGRLAQSLIGSIDATFDAGQTALITRLIGRLYQPWTVFVVYQMLDPNRK